MKLLVFAIAVALYLPTAQYGFVQDDRLIVENNPTVHSLALAVHGFGEPYWPPPNQGGLYRPLTILTYAVDWLVGGGRGWLFHIMNAVWNGLAAVLVMVVFQRWLTGVGVAAAGLVFAVHPVHVEAVAGIVGRADLLATIGILGAILCARRGAWAGTLGCAAVAMLSKEYGVVVGPLILLDDWLQPPDARRHSTRLYVAIGALTVAYFVVWMKIGAAAGADVAAPFVTPGVGRRLAVALPAVARAGQLLVWPVDLSADYGPQVIPVRSGLSAAAILGVSVILATVWLAVRARRAFAGVTLGIAAGAFCYLPTSNLFFPSGVVLAERNLYVAVAIVAAGLGYALARVEQRWGARRAWIVAALVVAILAGRSFVRLPAWRDNRSFLLTLLADHPESYHAHASAAAVLAGMHDTASARAEYARADSLFPADPQFLGAYALFLAGLNDPRAAGIAARARAIRTRETDAIRAQFLTHVRAGDVDSARALADTAITWSPWLKPWYQQYLR